MYQWAVHSKVREKDLYTYQMVLLLVRSPKSRLTDWAQGYANCNHYLHRLDIPEFAIDMHTRQGKSQGKNIDDFFAEGSKLHPHADQDNEQWYMEQCKHLWSKEGEAKRRDAEKPYKQFDAKQCDETRPPNLWEQD